MIAHTIQLALAPVFLLVAIGNVMNILSQRLGRVVDRSRVLQDQHSRTEGEKHDLVVREIRLVDRRIALVGQAILLLVTSGLTVGLVVALLFLDGFFDLGLQPFAAVFFIIAVGLVMGALLLFLKETREATEALRIPEQYLEKHREL